jgi:hypothetical protein
VIEFDQVMRMNDALFEQLVLRNECSNFMFLNLLNDPEVICALRGTQENEGIVSKRDKIGSHPPFSELCVAMLSAF